MEGEQSEEFDAHDEEMDEDQLLDLEQHQELEVDITESEDSNSMSDDFEDDEGLLELVAEDEDDFDGKEQCLAGESGSLTGSSVSSSGSSGSSNSYEDLGIDESDGSG
jgi:hypothetical protein